MNWFTKKRILVSSLVALCLYIISYFNRALELPDFYRNFCCMDDRMLNLFLIFIPIFIFTLIFLSLNEKKFESWKKFTFIYLIIYLIFYFIVPTQGDGYLWFQRETVSLVGSIFYLLFSLFLIVYKSFKKE